MIQTKQLLDQQLPWARIIIAVVLIAALATIATLVLGATGSPPTYDLTPDPMDPLWDW